MRKLSFDLGNYTTIGLDEVWHKGPKTEEDKKGHYVKFESRFKEIPNADIDDFDKSLKLEFDGKMYRYEDGIFEVENDKYERDNILLNLAGGLARLCEDNETIELIVGVPIKQHKMNKEKIVDMIMEHSTFELGLFRTEDKIDKKTVHIKKVSVVPEAIGAYFDVDEEILAQKGKADLILVDIGSKTTDICTIDKNNNIIKSNTLQRGSFDFYESIMNKINHEYTSACVALEEVQEIIEDGLCINNQVVDYSDLIGELLAKEGKEIAREIGVYEKKLARSLVIISGGYGATLFEEINKEIGHAKLHNNPVDANAEGYMEYILEKEAMLANA